MQNYKNVSQDILDQLNAEAEAEVVQIILIGIDNDIYSTVDSCPNACEMWKAIKRLKQGESINLKPIYIGNLENSHHGMVNHSNRITQGKSINLPTTTSELHQTPVEIIRIILQESIEAG
nr:hypothetical protein [Tanacetum cinerariifolium]